MRADGLDTLHRRTRTLAERELEPGERILRCATPIRTFPLVMYVPSVGFHGLRDVVATERLVRPTLGA